MGESKLYHFISRGRVNTHTDTQWLSYYLVRIHTPIIMVVRNGHRLMVHPGKGKARETPIQDQQFSSSTLRTLALDHGVPSLTAFHQLSGLCCDRVMRIQMVTLPP